MSTPRISVSTWSLHRQLGKPGFTGPAHDLQIPTETHNKGPIPLLDLPKHIAEFGINTMELCHFHLPSVEQTYLLELRAAFQDADVELFSLLIDEGDITHPSHAERDIAWIEKWIDIAGELGAKCARVIGGKAEPTQATLAQSQQVLSKLTERADTAGIRLMTENWFSIFSTPENVLTILDQLDGKVGLCLDFGNWRGEAKYTNLAEIAPLAESCHTKAHFTAPRKIDKDDYIQCLELTKNAGFAGPHTLIYDGPGDDEWEGLAIEREVVNPYLN
ncbi:sugar phosphate isomerase/epimerase [Candidatus Poribacteria bacterium]|nr:sugar phosphate isomerase/epimerase [Candidatus Poribacteria bacterium]MYB64315.1 sugar phosphate isomerase/epimerase [Candidatus Poribacteria bacterium]MYF57269.1 sugar phosphate isomerase/epimerase [Candidatus Poribacteria bacterium]MYI95190.1 sugar phosphate isomerase/epimerase [Candidatus Poribacteria bacterium]